MKSKRAKRASPKRAQRASPKKSKSPKRASPKKSKSPKRASPVRGCTQQTTAKYMSRKSPPYPANECQGKEMLGNDNNMWISKVSSNGVSRWVLQK